MNKIVETLVDRYLPLITSSPKEELLKNMLYTLGDQSSMWPVDKTNRWIGFIQGVLYMDGLIVIDDERDFTRPLFHSYYVDNDLYIPRSIHFEQDE